jgi:hypothetical protein
MIFQRASNPAKRPWITSATGRTSGSADGWSGPDAVRYMSVHS